MYIKIFSGFLEIVQCYKPNPDNLRENPYNGVSCGMSKA